MACCGGFISHGKNNQSNDFNYLANEVSDNFFNFSNYQK